MTDIDLMSDNPITELLNIQTKITLVSKYINNKREYFQLTVLFSNLFSKYIHKKQGSSIGKVSIN